MLRSALSKAAWVGRTASMVFGLALVMALVLGATSVALAGNLDPLKIGSIQNVATKTTALVGKVATGSAFAVKNPSGGSALGLQVDAGQAPLTVNPEAGKATNLDADKLDGKSDTDFYAAGSKVADSSHADQADSAVNAQDAAKLGGAPASDYQRKCQKGAVTGHVVVHNPSSLPNSWTEANNNYLNHYNCTGQPIRIIRYGAGRYAVEFVGQEYMGRTAVVSVESGYGRDDAFANRSYTFHYGDGIIARDVNIRTHDGTFVDSSFQLVAFQ